jgi:hypothetical protein
MATWDEVWKSATATATGSLNAHGAEVSAYLKESAEAHKQSLQDLAEAFANRQIDKATFERELEDERRVLRTELLAVRAISKKAAQDAANAFIDAIQGAVLKSIGGVI